MGFEGLNIDRYGSTVEKIKSIIWTKKTKSMIINQGERRHEPHKNGFEYQKLKKMTLFLFS